MKLEEEGYVVIDKESGRFVCSFDLQKDADLFILNTDPDRYERINPEDLDKKI